MKTRFDEMRDQFVTFHRAHLDVFDYFVRFANEMINSGYEHGATNTIIERIRWETGVVEKRGDEFKINNNFAPFYARLFMYRYPAHDGFFRTRHQTSMDAPATNLPPLNPSDYPDDEKGETK